MSDTDDELWSEVGIALTPRRSEAQWTALRLRTMSRVKGAPQAALRPWVAASALAMLGFGLLLISRLTREQAPVEVAVVAWDARLAAVEGFVTVVPAGGTDSIPATAGLPVQAGDVIQVGADGRADIAVADKGVISVGPGSSLKLAQLNQDQSYLELVAGSLVAKLDWHGDGRPHRLAVRTPAVVAAVRGTEFGVVVGEGGVTSVGVFDQGRVAVTDNDEASIAETMLIPNQEVRVAPGATPDTELREGRYFLRSSALNELAAFRPILERVRARERDVRRDWRPLAPEERGRERERRFGAAPPLGAPRADARGDVPRDNGRAGDRRGPDAGAPRGPEERREFRGEERGEERREAPRPESRLQGPRPNFRPGPRADARPNPRQNGGGARRGPPRRPPERR